MNIVLEATVTAGWDMEESRGEARGERAPDVAAECSWAAEGAGEEDPPGSTFQTMMWGEEVLFLLFVLPSETKFISLGKWPFEWIFIHCVSVKWQYQNNIIKLDLYSSDICAQCTMTLDDTEHSDFCKVEVLIFFNTVRTLSCFSFEDIIDQRFDCFFTVTIY